MSNLSVSRLNTIELRVRAGLTLASDARDLIEEIKRCWAEIANAQAKAYIDRELRGEGMLDDQRLIPGPSTFSFREAVRRVLRAADQPLHSKDIWLCVQEMGVTSNAKNPVGNVALTCHGMKGVTKVGPSTWQWTGVPNVSDPSGSSDPVGA